MYGMYHTHFLMRVYGSAHKIQKVHYLKRWGFPPKPIWLAYEQRPEAVRKWLDENPL